MPVGEIFPYGIRAGLATGSLIVTAMILGGDGH
jgi:hypothetical protein